MKQIEIKIDMNSIKVNENYGSTQTVVRTGQTVTVNGQGNIIPAILNYNNFGLHHRTETFGTNYGEWSGILKGKEPDNDLIQKLNKMENVNVTIENHVTTMTHPPIPKYSFKYENTDVKCAECKSTFKSDDFDSYSNDYVWSNTVCPLCGNRISGVKYQNIKDIPEEKIQNQLKTK